MSQSELLERMNGMFVDQFYSKPGSYWEVKINTSTPKVFKSYSMCDGLSTDLSEVVTQRECARDAYIDADIIQSSNMMANPFGNAQTHPLTRTAHAHAVLSVDVVRFSLDTEMYDSKLYGMWSDIMVCVSLQVRYLS